MAELPDDAIEAECEREDCQRIAATASDVYCQITGGLLSYPTYDARTILAHADEQTQKLVDEECARVRAEAVGAAAGPVSVGAVRDAAAAMLRWCDDPTASPTVLGSILAPLVPAVRAEAVAEIVEAIGKVLPEALGHNSLPDIVRGIGRQRDGQRDMKDHLVDVARRLTDERDRAVAEAVAERDAHWMQRLTDLQEEYGRIEEARERRLVRAVADERQRITEAVRAEMLAVNTRYQGTTEAALGYVGGLDRALTIAAGSVPVATPGPPFDADELLSDFAAELGVTIPDSDWGDALVGKFRSEIERAVAAGPVATPTRCESQHPRYGRCQLLAGHTVDHVTDQGADGDDDPGYSWPVATPTEPARLPLDADELLAEFAAELGATIPDSDWGDALVAKYRTVIEDAVAASPVPAEQEASGG